MSFAATSWCVVAMPSVSSQLWQLTTIKISVLSCLSWHCIPKMRARCDRCVVPLPTVSARDRKLCSAGTFCVQLHIVRNWMSGLHVLLCRIDKATPTGARNLPWTRQNLKTQWQQCTLCTTAAQPPHRRVFTRLFTHTHNMQLVQTYWQYVYNHIVFTHFYHCIIAGKYWYYIYYVWWWSQKSNLFHHTDNKMCSLVPKLFIGQCHYVI